MSDLAERLAFIEERLSDVLTDGEIDALRDAAELQAEVERLEAIKCPDNAGGWHRWNGDGQCKDCCNYATDLIETALKESNDD